MPANKKRGSEKKRTTQPAIVRHFAERLRARRSELGLTQEEVALSAGVTPSHLWRLESAGATPGIDLIQRLAEALRTSVADLLPSEAPAEPLAALQSRASTLFAELLQVADRETLIMLNPLLYRIIESQSKGRR